MYDLTITLKTTRHGWEVGVFDADTYRDGADPLDGDLLTVWEDVQPTIAHYVTKWATA